MTAAARYDRHPEMAVPGTGGQAWRGWDAVAAALRDATIRLSRDRDRVIVAVECTTGLLPEVRAGLTRGLRADLWLDAADAWVDAAEWENDAKHTDYWRYPRLLF